MSPLRNWRLGIFAMLTAAVTAVASCGAPDQGKDRAALPSAESMPLPISANTLPDPLDRYLPSPAEQHIIELGLKDAVDACVRRGGILPPASMQIKIGPALAFETSMVNIAGWLPLGSAQRFGYTAVADESDAKVLALDTGWSVSYRLPAADEATRTRLRAVLTGRAAAVRGLDAPRVGCLASGVEAVLGQRSSDPRQLADDIDAVPLFLTEQAEGEMQQDPRVRSVTARWQECMRRAGYSYASPSAAEADPRWLTAASQGASIVRLATMERPVATADARCRSSTGYTGVRLTVFDDDLDSLIADRGTQLRLQEFHAEVLYCVRKTEQELE